MAGLAFILGRSGAGKTDACLQAMNDAMEREPLGHALLLIVPEHMTYQAERALIARANGRGTMRAFVTGFRRLAWRSAERSRLPNMTEIGKRLIIQRIVAKRAGELSVLARGAGQRGFTASFAELIEELKCHHGTPEDLREAAGSVGDSYLKRKLQDIALLYGDFLEATRGRFEDAEDRMGRLAADVSQGDRFAGVEVWLDGFVFFNPQEREVIRAFLRKARAVHVTLPLGKDVAADARVAPSELFYRAAHTLQKLKRMAEASNVSYTVRVLGAPRRFAENAQGLAALERGLFHFPIRPETEAARAQGVRVAEAATRRLEMEAAGADMVRLCREEGFRWRDIGVLLRDNESYGELLELTLQEYGIPFFTDRKRAGVRHPLAELIRSALEVVTDGWAYDAVFRCVKTGLLPLTNDEADILENYALAFGIRGASGWDREWPYVRRRSSGAASDERSLRAVNVARQKVAEPFLELAEALKAESVQEKTKALYDFLAELHVPGTLMRWTTEAEASGALEEAKEHRMIWGKIAELFDQMAVVSGQEKISLSDYAAIVADGLDALELSLIPQKIDAVTIASFDQNSLNNIRALYILGANDGVMPRRPSAGGLLSDADRALIAAQTEKTGLELVKTGEEESCGENYLLYHGFTEAREYIWVSYALADGEGKGIGRSSVVARLLKLLPTLDVQSIPLEGMMPEQEQRLLFTTGKRAVSRLVPALREYVACPGESGRGAWAAVYNWALDHAHERLSRIVRGLFSARPEEKLPPALAKSIFARGGRLSGSVTRFERYYKCPFWHFAQSGLRLEEREEHGFRAPDRGTLMHDVMRGFGEKMRAEGRPWSDASADERAAFVRGAMESATLRVQNAILSSTAQYRDLGGRIEDTAASAIARLSEWDGISAFAPRFFELPFGEGRWAGEVLPCTLSDGETRLDMSGQIDRIDCGEIENADGKRIPYFLIIDYKTGQTELSLRDVYYGLSLQLLTYLEVARRFFQKREREERLPAGVLYCALRAPVLSGAKMTREEAERKFLDALRMEGWLLHDAQVIKSIDASARYIRVKLKPGDAIDGRSARHVKTAREFGLLAAHAMEKIRRAGEAVLAGDIDAYPSRTKKKAAACGYCPYGDVCGFDVKLGFTYHELDDTLPFMEAMEREGKACN